MRRHAVNSFEPETSATQPSDAADNRLGRIILLQRIAFLPDTKYGSWKYALIACAPVLHYIAQIFGEYSWRFLSCVGVFGGLTPPSL